METLRNYKNTKLFTAPGETTNNMVWIAGTAEQPDQNEVNYYISKGVNVAYEYVPPEGNDHSLSNWAVLHGRKYYNVETTAENNAAQQKYLTTVLDYKG